MIVHRTVPGSKPSATVVHIMSFLLLSSKFGPVRFTGPWALRVLCSHRPIRLGTYEGRRPIRPQKSKQKSGTAISPDLFELSDGTVIDGAQDGNVLRHPQSQLPAEL